MRAGGKMPSMIDKNEEQWTVEFVSSFAYLKPISGEELVMILRLCSSSDC